MASVKVAVLLLGLVVAMVAAQNPIVPAESVMKLIQTVPNGKMYQVTAPSVYAPVNLKVVHLYGTPKQMGFAHGQLLADEITTFMQKSLPDHIVKEVRHLDLSALPEWLRKLIIDSAPEVVPVAIRLALEYILKLQTPFLERSAVKPFEEMDAIAEGICSTRSSCDVESLKTLVRSSNLFPDLVRMACSVSGSWGPANARGHEGLIQMRLLDFGAGPFPNASVIIVQHPVQGNPFFSLTFPGFAGIVTGVSSKIALSEKVWMISGQPGTQPGTYEGEADVMVMRRMLQFANNIDEAVDMAHNANRTWAIFLGAGQRGPSAKTGKPIRIMTYRQTDVNDYDDQTISQITGAKVLPYVAYVDKHPQPSRSDNLGSLLTAQWGNITAEWTVQNAPRKTGSGDVHIAIYDFHHDRVFISTGVTDANGEYPKEGGGQAHSRTFLSFNLTRTWNDRL